ncbi:HAD family hydrolase [Streptomyces sp. NPDC056373]|uniref:HAD family hydrolase n=1 Tax=Streptomyces sp. NPDC056373 TaxID=3345798 RepID=UPI0035D6D716
MWAGFRARLPELVRCAPALLEGLSQLRTSDWRVSIVSNGMPDNQLAKIERAGVGERVDACCTSGEVGIRKPDVRIFELAAERCGADLAAGGWMIGDSPEHDVADGRAAGLRTVWIGRQQAWPRAEPQAVRTVPDAVRVYVDLPTAIAAATATRLTTLRTIQPAPTSMAVTKPQPGRRPPSSPGR